ncbi:MAG: DNA/RNA helicase domain-containing protein, partial [Flavobacteriales bacterium]
EIIPGNYKDKKGKQGISDPEQLRSYILNIYHTMMLRGIKGTYVYVCDAALKEYVRGVIQSNIDA